MVPAVTETLFAIGAGDRVVGVSVSCDHPPEAARLPKVGSFVEPVAEAIVALAPDLVLTSPTPGNQPAVRALERTGIRVEVVRSEGGISDVKAAILAVAAAAAIPEAGRELVDRIDRDLGRVSALSGSAAPPGVAVVVGREPLVLAGAESYLGELIEVAGGRNVAAALPGRWPNASYEYLLEAAPDVIVDLTLAMGGADAAAAAAAWADFPTIPAVRSGRVHPRRDATAATVLLRPGHRLADAARMLAGWIAEPASAAAAQESDAGRQPATSGGPRAKKSDAAATP